MRPEGSKKLGEDDRIGEYRSDDGTAADRFAAEVSRLRDEKVPGVAGRLRDLFDFLADRGARAEPATQGEIAMHVFGQAEPEGDDATVRVYVHRLRKRLNEHYKRDGAGSTRLGIPAGIYALRLADVDGADVDGSDLPSAAHEAPAPNGNSPRLARFWPAAVLALVLLAFATGWWVSTTRDPPVNAMWQPLIASDRPIIIVLGDYYIYGEIDPVRPEEGRLIRDFRVNSADDLAMMQDLDPERFARAEDVGLNYLPFSSAYALQEIVPVLRGSGKPVRILPASHLEPDMLNAYDFVYVGLLSGMGLLEQFTFADSGFALGESYDEVIDEGSGRSYISEEARSLASPAFYTDYAYLARFVAESGAQVAIVAGVRETGLRGLSPIAGADELPADVAQVAEGEGFEALFRITGQQGADLSERLETARFRAASGP